MDYLEKVENIGPPASVVNEYLVLIATRLSRGSAGTHSAVPVTQTTISALSERGVGGMRDALKDHGSAVVNERGEWAVRYRPLVRKISN